MNLYTKQLEKEGFTSGNAQRLAHAMDILHGVVAKMDKEQLGLLKRSSTIANKLDHFSEIEELRIFNLNTIFKGD